MKKTGIIIIFIIVAVLLGLVIRGKAGDPIGFQTDHDASVGGPFESTNTNSRYALVEAMVDDGRFYFDSEQASFASPDTAFYNGHYFSLFTPGISFMAVPFYFVGEKIGYPQLVTFLLNIIFALVNVYLVYRIALKIGSAFIPAVISGLLFLFATNALAYSLVLTQHQVASTLILIGILIATERISLLNNVLFGALFGFGLLVDIPNAFLMLPIGLYLAYKNIQTRVEGKKIVIKLRLIIIAILLGLIPLLAIFGWYNYQVAGSPTKLGQMLGRTEVPDNNPNAQKKPILSEDTLGVKEFKILEVPFNTRFELDGLYVLLISDERGWFYYSPVLILAVIGLYLAIRQPQTQRTGVLLGSVGMTTLILYSMFGDPYGGWSFGPRYLIPATAVSAAGVGVYITKWGKKIIPGVIFLVLAAVSIWISFMGALTTNAIPPKQEAIHLAKAIPYTYQYNIDLLANNFSSSLAFNLFFKNFLSAKDYANWLIFIVMFIVGSLYIKYVLSEKLVNIFSKSFSSLRPRGLNFKNRANNNFSNSSWLNKFSKKIRKGQR